MAKFSITIPDGYNSALSKWAEEIGDNKGSLAADLIKTAIAAKYPGKFPEPPDLSEAQPSEPDIELLLQDLFKATLNLGQRKSNREALTAEIIRGHFIRFATNFSERIDYMAQRLELTWAQCFLLLTTRDAPYSETDIKWASEQEPIFSKEKFLGINLQKVKDKSS